ncbi:MAG TPA: SDR family oxidoreductase [Candidatus Binataceae bacterium]|jgi:2-hydroxycyclohexanecarboxyl-CoA dehydrogenase|nr:SDR family oxidoreductase [Candidatus Binataceae bacterium]
MAEQKVAIVTGAARPWGIGFSVARGMAQKGLDVAIADLREDWGNESASKIAAETGRRAVFVKTDVTNRASVNAGVERVARELGRVDALANVAGIIITEPLEKMTDDGFDRQINVNLRGTALTCQAVIPYMRKVGGGRIVNIASGAAYQPLLNQTIYSATKAGVVALSRVLARELTRDKIVVTVIAPGATATAMGKEGAPEPQDLERMIRHMPWGRVLEPSEIADVVVYAATNPSHILTGQVLHCYGGAYMV